MILQRVGSASATNTDMGGGIMGLASGCPKSYVTEALRVKHGNEMSTSSVLRMLPGG
jgi:hypothetical protein